jgi:hypothetical protein
MYVLRLETRPAIHRRWSREDRGHMAPGSIQFVGAHPFVRRTLVVAHAGRHKAMPPTPDY